MTDKTLTARAYIFRTREPRNHVAFGNCWRAAQVDSGLSDSEICESRVAEQLKRMRKKARAK